MLEEDNKQYEQLKNDFEHLLSEDYMGAFTISQDALIIADRWNDIQLQASKIAKDNDMSKTDLQKWAYGRYRVLSMIHEKARVVWRIGEEQARYFDRNQRGI